MSRHAFRFLVATLGAATACSDQLPVEPTPPPATPSVAPAPTTAQGRVLGRVLARFAEGVDGAPVAAANGAELDRALGPGIWRLKVPSGQEIRIAEALSRNPNVVFAEPDYTPRLLAPCTNCFFPNDPEFERKWDHHNDGDIFFLFHFPTGKVDADIDWLEGFNYVGPNFTGSARIGFIDSGIYGGHPDLCSKVVAGYDFFSGSPTQVDDHGHGTHVAGIAAACANNGIGVTGVAYPRNISLLAAKVCDASGECTASAITEAIYWAVANGANVLNLSLGDTVRSQSIRTALQQAIANNVLPICAAGNDARRRILYPAADPECVAVTATNWSDGLSSYSNYGPEADVAAPGGDVEDPFLGTSFILSTSNDGDYVPNVGTSMATPQVSGLAALLFAAGMTNAADVRARLQSTADDLGQPGWDEKFGYGRINMFRAVDGLLGPGWQPAVPNASFTYSPAAPATGETVSFDGTGSADPDGSIAGYAWNFGDGETGSGETVQHAFAAAGSYVVTLTVTDDMGATGQTTRTVAVSATPGTPRPQAVLRLSAGSLSGLTNGDAVGSWPDPTTGRVATAPTTAARAIYKTAQTPTGSAAVHFQGDDYYEVPDESALEMDQSSTVMAVVAWDAISGDQALISKHSDNDTPGAYFAAVNPSGQLLVDRPWKQSGPRSTGTVTAGVFRLVVIRVSGTRVDFRIDRVAAGTATLSAGMAGNNPLRVGVLRHQASSVLEFFLRGRVADLLVFNTGLADAHVQSWENELYAAHLLDNNQPPNASFTFGPATPGTGETVNFDGSASSDADGSIASYAWNFGDGASSTGATGQHAYPTAGSYVVALTVTDNNGATAQTTRTVVVSATPGTTRPQAVLRLNAANLGGLANGDAVGSWPDPATGRVATAPTTAARAVYKTAQTPAGSPAVYFQGDDYYEVPDESAVELDQSSTVIAVVAWDAISGDQTLVSKHSDNATPGAYFAAVNSTGKLFVDRPWKESGPRSAGAVTAGIFRLVVIRVSGTRLDFRIDRAAAGTATLGTGVAGNNPLRVGVLRDQASSVFEFFLRGRVADLLVFNTGLADAHVQSWENELYATHLQNTNQAPNASFTYTPAAPGTGETVSFDGSGSSDADGSIASYAWNFGNGATATGATVQYAYAAAGSYVVTLTVTDNWGATAQTPRTVVVSATPGTARPQAVLRLSGASLAGLTNGAAVGSWPDPTTGRVATAPTTAARAVYETGQTPTGSAAVHFQGDDYYEVPDESALEMDQSSTVIAVVAWDAISGDQALVSKHSDNATPGAYFAALNANGQLLVDRPWKESGPRSTGTVTAGAFRLVAIRVSGTRLDFRIDRAAAGTATLSTGVAGNNPLRVGVLRHQAGSVLEFFLRGRVADLLVFNTGLADAHLQSWENELYATHLQSNQAPNASFTYSPAAPATGEMVSFNGSGSSDPDGSIASYAWNFGDGATATGATVQHAYAAAQSYVVTLTVTDNLGATGQTTRTVVVSTPPANQVPNASFTYSPAAPATGEMVSFDGSGSSDPDGSIASYAWNFGDAGTATGPTVQHPYATAGSYAVTLTVTDNKGATAQTTKTVVVSALPQAVLRLSAGSLSALANGAAVASWPDPATGRVATAPTAAARAVYKTGQTPAGTAAVHFQGDDYYEVPDESALELDQSSTVIAVVAWDASNSDQALVSKHSDNATPGAYFAALKSTGQLLVDRPWKESGPRSTTKVKGRSFRLVVIRVSGTRVDFRIDRAAAGSGTLGSGVAGNNPLRVGVLRHQASSVLEFFLRGRVADLLIFNTALTDAHVQAWENALNATHLQSSN